MQNDLEIQNFTNEELIKLLFTEKDALPKSVVDEFVRRGEEMINPLWKIIADTHNWQSNDENWWAVIHATFILGAIGGEKVIAPLIMSLKFADAYDCDWVWEALPAIFGKIGPSVLEPLKRVALDRTNNWLTRSVALDGLAAVTIKHPELEDEIFDFIASIMKDKSETMTLRSDAACILVDFKQKKYEKSLLKFAEEEEEFEEQDVSYWRSLDKEWILEELESTEKHLDNYINDWLEFYSPREIEERKKRWKREKSLWYKLIGKHLESWKFALELKKLAKPLPQIKLKYHQRIDKKAERFLPQAKCIICQKENIVIGSIVNPKSDHPEFICEDCAIDLYQEEHGFKSRKAAAARRRRIFDVAYLFEEMIIDEYLKKRNMNSIRELSEEELKKLMELAKNEYNERFSRKEKRKLEELRKQKQIEEEFRKVIKQLNFDNLV